MSSPVWRRLTSSRQRVAQFFRATFARVRADEMRAAEEHLSPAQAALFGRMARSDRRHCLDVYQTLCRAGYHDESLLRAALLHDVGKAPPAGGASGLPMTVWHRVAIVLLQAFKVRALGPRWLARLAADGRGWRAPFAVHVRHAEVGALWAAEVGCSPEVVALIRDHHPDGATPIRPDDPQSALQWADERN